MKLTPLAAVAGLALGGLLAYATPAQAEYPAQNGCVSEVHTCSSGSCSRAVPDAGLNKYSDGGAGIVYDTDSGVSLAFVRGYTVSVCGTSARPLAGAGTLKDYHCKPGGCPEVTANALSVTLVGTATTLCQEYPAFTVPIQYPAADRMVWASSGVTISNWDGGTADTVTVTVCPAQ